MNKKFSTLVAGLAFVTAASAADIVKTDGYTMLKSGTDYYLSVYGGKADSIVVKQIPDVTTASKAVIDSAMWKVSEAGVDATGNKLYSFVNKKTGATLSFAAKENAKPNLAAGIDKWSVAGGKISAFFAADKSLGLVVSNGELSLDAAASASAFSSEVNPALTARTLKAADLGDGFTVFSLSFGEAYEENIFEGKELVATQLSGADADYVHLQEVGADKIGGADAFFGLDTTKYTIAGQSDVFGFKFVKDTTYAAGLTADQKVGHILGNADFQKFQFVQDLSTDKVKVFVKAAPEVSGNTLAATTTPVEVVYAQVTNSKVLTVAKNDAAGKVEQGSVPSVTLSKGNPAALATGNGVYFIKVKSGNEFKYLYATAAGFELKKSAPNAYSPAGQFYVVAKDGKYQFVERNFNQGLTTSPAQIYKVTGVDAYRLDNVVASTAFTTGEEFYFEYQKDITVGGVNYMATKYLDEEAIDNFAYTLNLISGTEGVDNLYTIVDGVLKIKTTSADEAAKFKVEEASAGKVYDGTDEHAAGVGALAVGDTLATATYKLYQQYTLPRKYVSAADNKEFKVNAEGTPSVFKFQTASNGKGYLLSTSNNVVVLDVNTGKLISVADGQTNNNYFDLVVEPAPDYATLTSVPSHKIIKSAENDGKALSMNPTSLFAEVKLAGQESYIDSLFGLWIDTACVKDVTRPTYYITTSNGLDSAAQANGLKYFLINPQDSVFAATKDENGVYNTNTNNGGAYWNEAESLVKAAFVKASVYGSDSLAIATPADTLKDMSINPAAMAFVTTANNTLKIENKTQYTAVEANATTGDLEPVRKNVTSYLKVINNVLVWTPIAGEAHEFIVENTTLAPTANESVEDAVSSVNVISGNGTVTVQGAAGKKVVVSNILGKVVAQTVLTSDNATISVPAGIVAVAVEGEEADRKSVV